MKTILAVLAASALAFPGAAYSQDEAGPVVIGVRAAVALTTQDLRADGLEAAPGFGLGGIATYRATEEFHLGVAVNWSHQDMDLGSTTIGTLDTLTLLGQAEYHLDVGRGGSPYGFLGAGVNFNETSYTAAQESGCGCAIDADPSFAFRAGLGWDQWVSEAVALNLEAGWTLDAARARDTGKFDFEASSFSVLIGMRLRP